MPLSARAETAQDQEIEVIHTVGTEEGFCATTETIAVPAGTAVHYCFTIVNSNPVTLTNFQFSMPLLGISNTFQSVIPPGEKLAVTTGYLASVGLFLNPGLTSQINAPVNNTVTVYGKTQDEDEYKYMGQGIARVLVGEAQTTVRQTVGTIAESCADTTGIAVASGTTVYYCLTIATTGTLDFVRHEVRAPQLGATFVYTPANPSADSQQITAQRVRDDYPPNRLEKEITASFSNRITVTSYTSDGIVAESGATAVAVVGSASAALTYTVGTVADTCATSNTVTVTTNGTAYYCIRLKNTGTLPFTHFTIDAPQLNLQTNFTRTLGVGETIVLTRSFNAQLAKVVTAGETNMITVDAYTTEGIRTRSQGTANVSVGSLVISVAKYARSTPEGCVTTSPLTIATNTQFYYCVVITNTGSAPIERFRIAEPAPTNIDFSFDYRLEAGQKITLTNTFLANTLQIGSYLGPFLTTTNINPSLTVTAFSANGTTVPGTSNFPINIFVPTNTPVPTLTPSLTWTPTLTPIPTTTPTVPPSPTPTNVVISALPSATSVLGLDTVSTPLAGPETATPPGFVPESPLQDSALATPTPTIDFFATEAASTAIAITAAAVTVAAQTAEADATQSIIALTQQAPPPATATPIPTETPVPTASPTETPPPAIGAGFPGGTVADAGGSFGGPRGQVTLGNTNGDYLSLVAATLATSTATLGWLWFLVGSIIFFAVAGMFAGLSFRQQERRRYRMVDDFVPTDAEGELPFDEDLFGATDDFTTPWDNTATAEEAPHERWQPGNEATSSQNPDASDDDYWPASLP